MYNTLYPSEVDNKDPSRCTQNQYISHDYELPTLAAVLTEHVQPSRLLSLVNSTLYTSAQCLELANKKIHLFSVHILQCQASALFVKRTVSFNYPTAYDGSEKRIDGSHCSPDMTRLLNYCFTSCCVGLYNSHPLILNSANG